MKLAVIRSVTALALLGGMAVVANGCASNEDAAEEAAPSTPEPNQAGPEGSKPAPARDAGAPPRDSGTTAARDSGTTTTPRDSGTTNPPRDSGTTNPPRDSGTNPPVDSGTRPDSGTVVVDSGTPPVCNNLSSGKPACDTCMQGSCCAQVAACTASNTCKTFVTCAAACNSDLTCINACGTGAAEETDLMACLRGSCLSSCQ